MIYLNLVPCRTDPTHPTLVIQERMLWFEYCLLSMGRGKYGLLGGSTRWLRSLSKVVSSDVMSP